MFMFKKNFFTPLGIMAFFCLILSTFTLKFNMITAEATSSSWSVPHVYEQRTFQVAGKGVASDIANKQFRTTWSRYEPTGIFVSKDERVTLNVEKKARLFAYVQSFALHGSSKSWDEQQFTLKEGKNEIISRKNGILYLANEDLSGSISVSVEGGSHIPVFEKGTHKKEDLNEMLKKYPKAPYVEYVSERGLITVTNDSVTKYMKKKDSKNPEEVVNNLDIFLAEQDRVSGYDDSEGVHKQDVHYRHLIEDTKSDLYMYSTSYRTAYVREAIFSVLSGLKDDAWGPWHENGHQQQQTTLNFHNMVEVQVNVFSLAAEKALGFEQSRLERDNIYPKIENYLNLPEDQKNYDNLEDHFIKLGMLHQLTLSFGDRFYPELYRSYREMSRDEIPVFGKDQIFMYMSSQLTGYDLHPFFKMWGMKMTDDTKRKIQSLNLSPLEQEIWKSTDRNPVIVPTLELDSKRIDLTMSRELYNNKRVMIFHNDEYAYETYQGITYYGTTNNSDMYNTTVTSNRNLAYGDRVDVYVVPGKPGEHYDRSQRTHLLSKKMTGNKQLEVEAKGFNFNMNSDLFNSPTRIIFFSNDHYVGEVYEGNSYYLNSEKGNNSVTVFRELALSSGDTIKIYAVAGKPGSAIDLAQGVLLDSKTYLENSPQNSFGSVSMELAENGVTVNVPKELYNSDNRVTVVCNGNYSLEFYKGTTYYGTHIDTSDANVVKITKRMPLKSGDEFSVYTVPGTPGNSTDMYDMKNLLLKKKY